MGEVPARSNGITGSLLWPAVGLTLAFALQCELVFSKSVNWDEFFHYSEINQYLFGLKQPLFQTPYIFLFWWVPSLPGGNMEHIQLIRAMTLLLELISAACIYGMARQFCSRQAASISALAYVTGGYVFLHAFALRADPIATALLALGLWVFLCRPPRWYNFALVALLATLACIATIKSAFYFPAFLAIGLYRFEQPGQRRLIYLGLAAALASGIGLLLAGTLLPEKGAFALLHRAAELGNSSLRRMFSDGLFPRGTYLWKQMLLSIPLTGMIGVATFQTWKTMKSRQSEALVWLGLLFPLLAVALYRNAYPYHYVFALMPACVAIGPAAELLVRRYGIVSLSVILLLNAALLSLLEDRSITARQAAIQQGVSEIFPEPVSYIDESGMIGNFPRAVNRYASGWGLEKYLSEGRLLYSDAIARKEVPLVLANSLALLNVYSNTGEPDRLLPADEKILRENYLQHWGLVMVAGKVIEPGPEASEIEIVVPGVYTVEGAALEIDKKSIAVGGTVNLARDRHTIGGGRLQQATLRWGDHLARPAFPWPDDRIFTDY